MLVALTGKLGSGKSTVGQRLAQMTTLPSEEISFAQKLKESAAALFGIDPKEWEWMKNDPTVVITLQRLTNVSSFDQEEIYADLTARTFLQRYGTEAHRDIFGTDFWTDQALTRYDVITSLLGGDERFFYVADCRFENEAQAIVDRGGLIFLVQGTNQDIEQDQEQHISEGGLPDFFIDEEIYNHIRDDNYQSLDSQLRLILESFDIPWA